MKNKGTGMNYVALRQAIQGKSIMFGGYNNDDDEDNNEAIKELVSYAKQHGYYPQSSQFYEKLINDELSWQQQ
jgi:hypothetical protein